MKLLLLNCYPKTSREKFERDGVAAPDALFQAVLARRASAAAIDLLYPADPGVRLPAGAALADYDGVIWTGSDLTAYHDDERVARMLEFARAAFAAGTKSYGSCWGLQIAAAAAGGTVAKMTGGREWGVAQGLRLTAAGRRSPLHAGKPAAFCAFEMHLDEVSRLPTGSEILSANAHCRVQSAAIAKDGGLFWGTQFHCEYNLREMAKLIAARAAPLVKEGLFADRAAVLAHAEKMQRLHAAPENAALARALGVDDSILDAEKRERELANWLQTL